MDTTTPAPTTISTFLLLTRDDGRPQGRGQPTGTALAGALLTDLVAAGRLGVDDDGARLRVLDTTPTGDPLLDEGLRRFSGKDGKKLAGILGGVGRHLDEEVGRRLADQGVVRVETGGLLRATRYPTVDPGPERELRSRLEAVLRGGTPTRTDRAVLGLVKAVGRPTAVFDADALGMTRRELKDRVAHAAEHAGAGADAVQRAVDAAATAAVAAVAAASVSATMS